MRKMHLWWLAVVASLMGAVFASSDTAQAASGNCFFTQTNYYVSGTGSCSVSGWGDYAVNDVLTGRNGDGTGSAMPASTVNSKSQFISYITNRFNNGGTQDKVGSAFIMQKMRGVNNWPSASEVSDWAARMNSPDITFHSISNQRVASSSWYDTSKRNVFIDSRPSVRDVVEIRHNGRVVIQIIRACGNPTALQLETLPGLWDIDQETRVKNNTSNPGTWSSYSSGYSQTAEVGQQVLFMHRIRNAGNANTPSTGVSAVVQTFHTANPGAYTGGERTAGGYASWSPAGIPLSARALNAGADYYYYNGGGSGNQQELRRTVENRVGQYLCQRIATPGSQGDTRWEFSRPACIRIVAAPWNITGRTQIKNGSAGTYGTSQINAAPGNMLYWNHRLDRGGSGTPSAINYRITRFVEGGPSSVLAESSTSAFPFTRSADTTAGYRYTVRQDDVGRRVCQSMRWNPTAHNNTAQTTTQACAFIPYNYQLTPSVTPSVPDGGIVELGNTVDIRHSLVNSGPTKSRPAEWRLVEVIIPSGGGTPQTGGASAQDPCVYRPGAASCEVIDSGSNRVFNPGSVLLGIESGRTIGDLDVGTRICWGLSVVARSHSDTRWQHSALSCVSVGKKPKVQFWGGDVRSGKEVITSLSRRGEAYYGSWAEYALFSATTSADATSSSGAGLSATAAGRDIAGGPISYNRITFGNTPSYGGFNASQSVIPSMFLASGTNITASNVDVNALPSGVNTRSGNLTLRASTLTPGKRIFIRATGTVTIDGNINYATGPFASLSDIPQLAIIAQNIVINPDVTELNGWLIARESNPSSSNGYVSTCGPVSNPASYTNGLKSTVCDKPLKINGPIIANHLYLRRTAGAEKEHPGIPAEILNLRPDVYLSYFGSSRNSGAIKTSYLKELPPRF